MSVNYVDNTSELRRSTTIVYRTDRQALPAGRFCRTGQLATANAWFRTCPTSSFCTVAWQLARFQLTGRIARSLGAIAEVLGLNTAALLCSAVVVSGVRAAPTAIALIVLGSLYGAVLCGFCCFFALPRMLSRGVRGAVRTPRMIVRPRPPAPRPPPRPPATRYNPGYGPRGGRPPYGGVCIFLSISWAAAGRCKWAHVPCILSRVVCSFF